MLANSWGLQLGKPRLTVRVAVGKTQANSVAVEDKMHKSAQLDQYQVEEKRYNLLR